MRVNGFRRFLLFVVGTAAVLYLPGSWSGLRAETPDDTVFTYYDNGEFVTERLEKLRADEEWDAQGGHQPWRKDPAFLASVMAADLLPPAPPQAVLTAEYEAANGHTTVVIAGPSWRAEYVLAGERDTAAFVSLHCNAPSTTQRSTIVYYRSDIVSSQAMSAPLVSNFPAVWYLFRTFTTTEAAPLPRQTMLRELADRNNRLHTWKMPCNLMEMVMLTNEEDEALIALTEGQAAFAEDIHKSYCGFTFSEMLYFD